MDYLCFFQSFGACDGMILRWEDGGCRFMKKQFFVKMKLVDWNRNTFGLLKDKKNKLCAELQDIDGSVDEDA